MRSVAPRLGYSWLNLSPQLQSPGKRRQQTLGSDLFVTSTKTAIHLSANDDVGSSPQNWLTSVQLRIHKDPFTVPWIGTIQGNLHQLLEIPSPLKFSQQPIFLVQMSSSHTHGVIRTKVGLHVKYVRTFRTSFCNSLFKRKVPLANLLKIWACRN